MAASIFLSANKTLLVSVDLIGEKNQVILECDINAHLLVSYLLSLCYNVSETAVRVCRKEFLRTVNLTMLLYWLKILDKVIWLQNLDKVT